MAAQVRNTVEVPGIRFDHDLGPTRGRGFEDERSHYRDKRVREPAQGWIR
jgi:hypothetical protein